MVPGKVEKAVVDPDEAQVGDPADDRRGRVGVEHPLEPGLGLVALAHVLHHQGEATRRAIRVDGH